MIKKNILLLLSFVSLSACDCSTQIAYAFVNQMRLLKKEYKPLKNKTDDMTKTIKKMADDREAENERLKKLIIVETQEALTIANIVFLYGKKNKLPFVASKPLNLKIDLVHQ